MDLNVMSKMSVEISAENIVEMLKKHYSIKSDLKL